MAAAANFVKIIEEYPCLYNNKLAEYSRKDVTDRAWREVAQKTKASVTDCIIRWRNIRNGFVRSLKPTPSGSSTKQKKLYYLHEELQFVLPFVKTIIHTGEPGNVPVFPEVETEDIENAIISNSSTNEEPAESATTAVAESPESVSNKFKRAKIRKATNEADEAFLDWMESKETQKDNPRRMFLLSLLPDVDSLSEEQMRKFRIKVLLLLEDIRSGPSQQQQPYSNNYSSGHHPQQYTDNYSQIQHWVDADCDDNPQVKREK